MPSCEQVGRLHLRQHSSSSPPGERVALLSGSWRIACAAMVKGLLKPASRNEPGPPRVSAATCAFPKRSASRFPFRKIVGDLKVPVSFLAVENRRNTNGCATLGEMSAL